MNIAEFELILVGVLFAIVVFLAAKGRWSGDKRTADQIISEHKKSSVNQEFPDEYKSKTPDEIYKDAENKKIDSKKRKKAKTAKKLLDRKEYDK